MKRRINRNLLSTHYVPFSFKSAWEGNSTVFHFTDKTIKVQKGYSWWITEAELEMRSLYLWVICFSATVCCVWKLTDHLLGPGCQCHVFSCSLSHKTHLPSTQWCRCLFYWWHKTEVQLYDITCSSYTASQVALVVKNPPANAGDIGDSGQEDSLQKGLATHSSILAWRSPWTEVPGQLQSIGSQRAGHNWSDLACTHACIKHQPTTNTYNGYLGVNWLIINLSSSLY